MAPVSIEVRGRIGLTDLDAAGGGSGADREQARNSRLNDVMIVLERERPELEAAIAARLRSVSVGNAFDRATLQLDPNRPEFRVLVQVTPAFAKTLEDAAVQAALETDVAAPVFAMIDRRAGPAAPRRWQPSVTADYHTPERPNIMRAVGASSRLNLILVLLALVVLAGSYLALRH